MLVSNMVGDKLKEHEDMRDLPMFDSTNLVTWSKKFKSMTWDVARRPTTLQEGTNVSSLGEIYLVDSNHVPVLLQEADCILKSDSVTYREPALQWGC